MDAKVLSWCKRLIRCRSVTGEGTRAIAEMCVRELLAPLGIEARLVPSSHEGSAQVNLVARIKGRDSAAAPVVLNTHLDTVPPGENTLWTKCGGDPFAPTIDGDRIYGLGAADTKLDFVAKVTALAACGTPRRDVHLVGTFGEEHGLVGAKEVVAAGLLPHDALAYVGEPSRLQVITAHKGLMVFELTAWFDPRRFEHSAATTRLVFEGRSAHSSTPSLGRNAICLALARLETNPQIRVASIAGGDAVNKVPARCEAIISGEFDRGMDFVRVEGLDGAAMDFIPPPAIEALALFVAKLQSFADHAGVPEPDYAHPTLTSNPGVIKSQADSLTLQFELRPSPALPLETVRRGVGEITEEIFRKIPQVKLELSELRANPGFRSALDGEAVGLAMAALAHAGLPLESGVKAGCTEAGVYSAAGLRPVVFGPGPSTGVIHAPNEYNFLADVGSAIEFYRQLLQL
jgi:acetylornithine deacetylase/succinyl-diaminopimelate desuccinylase-like protein